MQITGVPSPIIDAAIAILADGKARTADEILAEGRRRGLFDASVTRKHVYTSLSQYIERAAGSGRKPEIAEDVQHRFRLNRAPDDWPDIDATGLRPLAQNPPLSAAASAAIARIRKASQGSDPTEYELAVCALFENAGFAATHLGGTGAPDGYADALLGPLGYRVMIECKLAEAVVIAQSDAPVEASKFKGDYRGDCCILAAPAYAPESSFVAELHAHGVSAWTTEDLVALVAHGVDAMQARALFAAPGIAADAIEDLEWNRVHGAPKRLRVLASLVLQHAAAQQRMADCVGAPAQAPHFTADVAIALTDAQLAARGCAGGCTREEVQAVFEWLTNPLVRRAVWTDAARASIVVL